MSKTAHNFTYLESKITSDGKSHTGTLSRIGQTGQAFYQKKEYIYLKHIKSGYQEIAYEKLCMERNSLWSTYLNYIEG